MPADITIEVDYQNTQFTPGDTISGKLRWQAPRGENKIALRLFWFTSGRGTQEVEVIDELSWSTSQGSANFSFPLPHEPYSFAGSLIELTWALDAVFLPSEEASERFEFDLTPDGQKISLSPVQTAKTKEKKNKWFSVTNNRA
ncbi:hypothetical protein JO972_14720 [Verrucomicrobiaceae bacterium 5K15]|uniref:Arrestin-like N-terminal domain-containing protein n=1 Tax=Oceaniferula flava TaxID=2800421 RepID=A0AAE2SDJ2_9BACT|nr:hypothetical protein [Oceaniferula flavus]MBK1856220.1 hypothetical protein [Oceaniferula flavus]MBM1137527.1 hypothetical protein [Oceaniferula flavus]